MQWNAIIGVKISDEKVIYKGYFQDIQRGQMMYYSNIFSGVIRSYNYRKTML